MNLKDIRKSQNLTQLKLAEASGCKRSTIGKIETGAIKPSVKLAKRIACVLGFDWTLFYEEGEEHEKDYSGHDGRCAGCTGASNKSRPAERGA